MSKQHELVQFSRGSTGGGSKNLVTNGAAQVSQRGSSFTSVSAGEAYTVDRFGRYINLAGTWDITQSTDTPTGQGFANSIKFDCTTANGSLAANTEFMLFQRFEGQDLQRLKKGTANAEKVTLSFWVKSSKTGTYITELYDNNNARHISKAYTINSANTWEKKALTFDGDTTGAITNNNLTSIQLNFFLANGSNWTSGTLQTSWGANNQANRAVGQVNLADSTSNDFYLTGIQLEVNDTSTDFEFENYGTTLAKCERFYQKHTTGSNQYTVFLNGSIDTTANIYLFGKLNGTMRAAPAFSTANTYLYTQPGGVLTYSGITNRSGLQNASINFSSLSSGTQGYGIRFESNVSNGYVEYDAEL